MAVGPGVRENTAEFLLQYLPFDRPAALAMGQLRAQLVARGTPIGPYDLQIAAIALVNNFILVTHNTREFQRVEVILFTLKFGQF